MNTIDFKLFNEGKLYNSYNILGAHVFKINDEEGTLFRVWAPNAKNVSIIGSFNDWDVKKNEMKFFKEFGIWELFIPLVSVGSEYRYNIELCAGNSFNKADPYSFVSMPRSNVSFSHYAYDLNSIVYDLNDGYTWQDNEWIERRNATNYIKSPISIYELHIDSWRKQTNTKDTFRIYADQLVKYVKDMGYTHISIMPINQHLDDASLGYEIVNFFSLKNDYGTPINFKCFIDSCHQAGIGVILSQVLYDFSNEQEGLKTFDGTKLYEKKKHEKWDTFVFDYSKRQVVNFLISNVFFWIKEYHIDGFVVNHLSEIIFKGAEAMHKQSPEHIVQDIKEDINGKEFIRELNQAIHDNYPSILMLAADYSQKQEITNSLEEGGLGFSFRWDHNDIFNDIFKISFNHHLKYYKDIFRMFELGTEILATGKFINKFSHDGVVYGKSPMLFKSEEAFMFKFSVLRLKYGTAYLVPGKKLMFMGNEIAVTTEWDYKNSIDWELTYNKTHKAIQRFVSDLNKIYREEKALHEEDINLDWVNTHYVKEGILCFIRRASNRVDDIIVIINISSNEYESCVFNVELKGAYKAILNSNSKKYETYKPYELKDIKTKANNSNLGEYLIKLNIHPYSVLALKYRND